MALKFRQFDRRNKEDLILAGQICKSCGNRSVKTESAFVRTAVWTTQNNPQKLWCEFLGEEAFYLCLLCKNHVRCLFVVVCESEQGKGLGKILVQRILSRMKQKGIKKLTFRTNQDGSSLGFWKKCGAKIVDVKGNDYEMELNILLEHEGGQG